MYIEDLSSDGRVTGQPVEKRCSAELAPVIVKIPKGVDLFIQVDEPAIDDECW